MKDPVCGVQVEDKTPSTSSYKGQKYAFCGKECKDKFDRNPERYAAQSRSGVEQEQVK
jgi:YHS domain-containing protein